MVSWGSEDVSESRNSSYEAESIKSFESSNSNINNTDLDFPVPQPDLAAILCHYELSAEPELLQELQIEFMLLTMEKLSQMEIIMNYLKIQNFIKIFMKNK